MYFECIIPVIHIDSKSYFLFQMADSLCQMAEAPFARKLLPNILKPQCFTTFKLTNVWPFEVCYQEFSCEGVQSFIMEDYCWLPQVKSKTSLGKQPISLYDFYNTSCIG